MFTSLLRKALNDWPKEITFGPLYRSNFSERRYTVKKLFPLCEKIIKPYLGTSDEILMRNLHDAIFVALHSLAAFSERINLQQLRKEAVQREFEARLRHCYKQKDAGWTNEDKKRIREYFKSSTRQKNNLVSATTSVTAQDRALKKNKRKK